MVKKPPSLRLWRLFFYSLTICKRMCNLPSYVACQQKKHGGFAQPPCFFVIEFYNQPAEHGCSAHCDNLLRKLSVGEVKQDVLLHQRLHCCHVSSEFSSHDFNRVVADFSVDCDELSVVHTVVLHVQALSDNLGREFRHQVLCH